jgi:undecaprenyl-diphosphatase
VLMSWARLASAHHYPSDVAVGTALGVSVSYPISVYALAASRLVS